jgi:hypothetical protein
VVLGLGLFPASSSVGLSLGSRSYNRNGAKAVQAAGGQELEARAKETLLPQLLARRVGLQAKEGPFDALTAHHPNGKHVWDLED